MEKLQLSEKLSGLQKQVKVLISAHAQLKKDKSELMSENTLLKAEVEALRGQVADFQNQDKITKIVSKTTVEKEESTELKHKLNEYIKEIDRCITHLSQ